MVDWIKTHRHKLADWLEDWGTKHNLYAVPMVSTVRIRNEILRTPLFSNKEKHIRNIVKKFTPTQPSSIRLILDEIKKDHPIEYSIALSEFEAIKNEIYK